MKKKIISKRKFQKLNSLQADKMIKDELIKKDALNIFVKADKKYRWLHQYTWTELDMNGSGLIMVELAVRCSKAAAMFASVSYVSALAPGEPEVNFIEPLLDSGTHESRHSASARPLVLKWFWKLPPDCWYGQQPTVVMPRLIMYSHVRTPLPPLHPLL